MQHAARTPYPVCAATHCHSRPLTATHRNTLQQTATHRNNLCNTLQHAATHCNTLQQHTHTTICTHQAQGDSARTARSTHALSRLGCLDTRRAKGNWDKQLQQRALEYIESLFGVYGCVAAESAHGGGGGNRGGGGSAHTHIGLLHARRVGFLE